ncbi:MAG: hypothetical protein ABSB82_25725 [Terriglobia bacterium]|jgi:hypothetical protein
MWLVIVVGARKAELLAERVLIAGDRAASALSPHHVVLSWRI